MTVILFYYIFYLLQSINTISYMGKWKKADEQKTEF